MNIETKVKVKGEPESTDKTKTGLGNEGQLPHQLLLRAENLANEAIFAGFEAPFTKISLNLTTFLQN